MKNIELDEIKLSAGVFVGVFAVMLGCITAMTYLLDSNPKTKKTR